MCPASLPAPDPELAVEVGGGRDDHLRLAAPVHDPRNQRSTTANCGQVSQHVVGRKTNWGHVFWFPVLFLGFSHGMLWLDMRHVDSSPVAGRARGNEVRGAAPRSRASERASPLAAAAAESASPRSTRPPSPTGSLSTRSAGRGRVPQSCRCLSPQRGRRMYLRERQRPTPGAPLRTPNRPATAASPATASAPTARPTHAGRRSTARSTAVGLPVVSSLEPRRARPSRATSRSRCQRVTRLWIARDEDPASSPRNVDADWRPDRRMQWVGVAIQRSDAIDRGPYPTHQRPGATDESHGATDESPAATRKRRRRTNQPSPGEHSCRRAGCGRVPGRRLQVDGGRLGGLETAPSGRPALRSRRRSAGWTRAAPSGRPAPRRQHGSAASTQTARSGTSGAPAPTWVGRVDPDGSIWTSGAPAPTKVGWVEAGATRIQGGGAGLLLLLGCRDSGECP